MSRPKEDERTERPYWEGAVIVAAVMAAAFIAIGIVAVYLSYNP
jgi:hypothetical protein